MTKTSKRSRFNQLRTSRQVRARQSKLSSFFEIYFFGIRYVKLCANLKRMEGFEDYPGLEWNEVNNKYSQVAQACTKLSEMEQEQKKTAKQTR